MLTTLACLVTAQSNDTAILNRALNLMGGESVARSTSALKIKGLASLGLNEQSERYTGPVLTNFVDFDLHLDLAASKVTGELKTRGAQMPDWTPGKISADFSTGNPVRPTSFLSPYDLRDQLAINPARILLYAKGANLTRLADVKEGVDSYQRVSFDSGAGKVVLWFRTVPGNLDRVEQISPRDLYWSAWKSVKTVLRYANWQILSNGLWYPHYADETRNGVRYAEWNLTDVQPENGTAAEAELLAKEQKNLSLTPMQFKVPLPKLVQLSPGLWQYPGGFPCEVLEGTKELLVIDAPYNQAFCEAVIKDLATRFPGKTLAGLVLTDPYWPHQAGFPVFAKLGVPIYSEPRNLKLWQELAKDWGVTAKVTGISKATTFPQGWVILPLKGVVSERFLNVYSPKEKFLFCSDTIVWKSKTEFYNKAGAIDVARMVAREGLPVENYLATHTKLLPWARVKELLPVN